MICLELKAIKLKESIGTFPENNLQGHALFRAEGYKNEGIHRDIPKKQKYSRPCFV